MLLTQSCIVADPPEYRHPVKTRPVLDVYKALPLNQALLVVFQMDTTAVNFNVPVRSEDAGEDLFARFILDYRVDTMETTLNGQTLPASTYDDTSRSAAFPWHPHTTLGCHLLTLIVAHESSFDPNSTDHLIDEKAADDAAIMNWWVNVVAANASPEMVHSLSNCPVSEPPTLPQ